MPISRLHQLLGGPARARVVVLLASVLGLQSADLATVGAVGGELERSLAIDHLQLASLASIATLAAAFATLPFGPLADRHRRVRLLAASVSLWAAAMVAAGLAGSYQSLLIARVFLGIVISASGPLLASLMGDFFPETERARIYGYILSGELIGTGFGFLASGNVAALLSWRWAFWVLAIPAGALALALSRLLPEPARGGSSRLLPGATAILGAREAEEADNPDGASDTSPAAERLAHRVAREAGIEADPDAVLDVDPDDLSLWRATLYVLHVQTNLILIVASAAGYLFIGGVETFGVIYMRDQYGLSQAAATSTLSLVGVGALAGVLLGGRIADRRLRQGDLNARIAVAASAFTLAAALALPPFLFAWPLWVAMPLFILGTMSLSCGNAPLDAARLDVMTARLWGRAEAARTALRSLAVALAPLIFGLVAGFASGPESEGLRLTFAAMLLPLGLSGLIVGRARKTYGPDIATALASERSRDDANPGSTVSASSTPRHGSRRARTE